jgi:lipoyl-dependent peroxiredoxin
MKRFATSVWNGSGKEGTGNLTTQSLALDHMAYSFNTRFGDGNGTNPEELIAAAHAGCFNMALSFALGGAGFAPDSLTTRSTLTMEMENGHFSIKSMHLELTAAVLGIAEDQFAAIAADAKANCPVSKALSVPITLEAHLTT